jgi:hypothetical protein
VRRVAVILAAAALFAGAPEARAQKDVGDPLEHFLGTAAPGRAHRTLDDGVARTVGDFNNDGLADVALWQESDFGPYHGPVFLYLGRKDGRFAAAGTIVANAGTLFKPVAGDTGSAKLLVCERGGGRETVASGYALDGFIVSDLPREALPRECPRVEAVVVERLDVKRYRENGMQAWISR